MTWTTYCGPISRIKPSNNSHNNYASFVYALASTLLINIVPLGQLTKKFRIDLPFPSVHPSNITVHPVVFHVFLSRANLYVYSCFPLEGDALSNLDRKPPYTPGNNFKHGMVEGVIGNVKSIPLQRKHLATSLSTSFVSFLLINDRIEGCPPGVDLSTK
jgi:hypothetical protein